MEQYEQFPLYEKSIRREWFRFPFQFPINQGDIYKTPRTDYRAYPYRFGYIQMDNVGDWVEIVLPEEHLRIRFYIF